MFSKQIVDSDAFLDMPATSQLLYFHLNMQADDDGFVGNPKKVVRIIGASEDDLKILIAKRFVLVFHSGVMVIKHWKLHNNIQKDRYHETQYLEEKKGLFIKENKVYTERIQDVHKMDTEYRLDKVRLDKTSIGESGDKSPTPSQIAREFFNQETVRRNIGIELAKKYNADLQAIAGEIRKFTQYWTEPNKSGTRQRWETEKTFEVSRRLEKWFANIKQFKTSKPTKTLIL